MKMARTSPPTRGNAPSLPRRSGAVQQSHPAQRLQPLSAAVEEEASASNSGSAATSEELSASRRYLSIFPPLFARETLLEEFGPGLWGLRQPLALPGFDVRLRMTVARLDNGNLLLVSPVAPTGEVLAQLASLGGAVQHIVLPSTSPEHWNHGPALSKKFPSATVWTVPGFWEGKGLPFPGFGLVAMRQRNPCKVLGEDALPAELEGQLAAEVLAVPFFVEAAIVLPRHGALLLSDTAMCLYPADYPSLAGRTASQAEAMGILGRLGPITKTIFDQYPGPGGAWISALLARQDWDVVIGGHGSAPVRTGQAAFRACFGFMPEARS